MDGPCACSPSRHVGFPATVHLMPFVGLLTKVPLLLESMIHDEEQMRNKMKQAAQGKGLHLNRTINQIIASCYSDKAIYILEHSHLCNTNLNVLRSDAGVKTLSPYVLCVLGARFNEAKEFATTLAHSGIFKECHNAVGKSSISSVICTV